MKGLARSSGFVLSEMGNHQRILAKGYHGLS